MKRKYTGIYFVLPGFAGMLLFYLIPFLDVMRRSVYAALGDGFVGLANYRAVLTNEAFRLAAKNTGRFLLTCIPILLVLSLLVALGIRELCRLTWLKNLYLIPFVIPSATTVLLWQLLLERKGVLTRGAGDTGAVPPDVAEESVSDPVCDPVSDNGSAVAAFAGTQGRVKWNAGGYYRACGLDERQSRLWRLGLLLYLEKSGVSCGALAGRTARCAKGNLRGGVNGWGGQARNTAAHSPALSKTCHLYDHGHCDRQFL